MILAQTVPSATSNVGKVNIALRRNHTIRLDYFDSAGQQHHRWGSYVFPAGSWHTVELRERVGVGTGSVRLLVSGTTVVAGTGLDTGAQGVGRFAVGNVFATSAAARGHLYIDDVRTTTTNPVHTGGQRPWT